ncbi:hypothetical protein ACIBSW_34590 [Actinoplanes sp. NPDC049668]|uniref:hypothetical protein n=1 Tax=unclassified Actinoplanes TaxID=2626549 RepID=UPI0033BC9CB7
MAIEMNEARDVGNTAPVVGSVFTVPQGTNLAEMMFGASLPPSKTGTAVMERPIPSGDSFDFGEDINPAPEPGPAFTVESALESNKAAKAMEAEVQNLGVLFQYEGVTYTIPKADDWDLEVFEASEEGRFVTAVKSLLGPYQWKKFKDGPDPDNKPVRKAKDLELFFTEAQKALGGKKGEFRKAR